MNTNNEAKKGKSGPKAGYRQTEEHIKKRIRFGEDHANWVGDSISEKAGRGRAQRKYKQIGPCVLCGNEKSERHHIDGNTANNEAENILIVCRRCHMKTDGRLSEFTALAIANQKVAVAKRWINRADSTYKTGDKCPCCSGVLSVVATRIRGGYKFCYLGCRKSRKGCGFNAGSIKSKLNESQE